MKLHLVVLILLLAASGLAQAPPAAQKPLSKDEILELTRNYVPSQRLAELVQRYGINFRPEEDYFKALREVGGEEVLIQALRAAKPARPLNSAASPDVSENELKQHMARAIELRAQKDYPQAEKEYRAALRLAPVRADIHFLLGVVLLEQKKWEGAITENREALRLRPEMVAAHNNLGWAFYQQGNLEEAKAEYHEALHLRRNYPRAHHSLGLVLEKAGDVPAAAQEFRAACELERDNPSYRASCEKLAAQTSTPEPPPKAGPVVHMTVDSVRFFETADDLTPVKARGYVTRFKRSSIRHIGWELRFTHPKPESRVDFKIEAVWFGPSGNLLHRQTMNTFVPVGSANSWSAMSWGCPERPCKLWEVGEYRVDFFVGENKIATGSFEIH